MRKIRFTRPIIISGIFVIILLLALIGSLLLWFKYDKSPDDNPEVLQLISESHLDFIDNFTYKESTKRDSIEISIAKTKIDYGGQLTGTIKNNSEEIIQNLIYIEVYNSGNWHYIKSYPPCGSCKYKPTCDPYFKRIGAGELVDFSVETKIQFCDDSEKLVKKTLPTGIYRISIWGVNHIAYYQEFRIVE